MTRKRTVKRRGRPAFSVGAIVRNESEGLPRLLESLAEFRHEGGEVIVLDTGSEDETPRIAREAGCRVFSEPKRFEGQVTSKQAERIQAEFSRDGEGPLLRPGTRFFDFAGARNFADSLAGKPFVLAVDGRDVVEAMDIAFVDGCVRSGDAQVLRFETRRWQRGGWVLEARDYLHDRRHTTWVGRDHPQVRPLDPQAPFERRMLPRDRLRVTHDSHPTKSREHQLAGVALDVLSSPHSSHRRLLLGHELAARGFVRSATAIFMDLDGPTVPPEIRSAALSSAAACLVQANGGTAGDEVLALLFKASQRDSSRRGPFLQLGRHSLAAGDFQAAVCFASAALSIPARVQGTEPEENHRQAPHAILYWALLWLGRREEARAHYEECLRLDPGNPAYRDHARLLADPAAGAVSSGSRR